MENGLCSLSASTSPREALQEAPQISEVLESRPVGWQRGERYADTTPTPEWHVDTGPEPWEGGGARHSGPERWQLRPSVDHRFLNTFPPREGIDKRAASFLPERDVTWWDRRTCPLPEVTKASSSSLSPRKPCSYPLAYRNTLTLGLGHHQAGQGGWDRAHPVPCPPQGPGHRPFPLTTSLNCSPGPFTDWWPKVTGAWKKWHMMPEPVPPTQPGLLLRGQQQPPNERVVAAGSREPWPPWPPLCLAPDSQVSLCSGTSPRDSNWASPATFPTAGAGLPAGASAEELSAGGLPPSVPRPLPGGTQHSRWGRPFACFSQTCLQHSSL